MKSAEEILKELYCCDHFEDKADLQLQITLNPDLDRILQAMHEYAEQSRWVKVNKDNLPTCEVLAGNDSNVKLVGVLNREFDNIYCYEEVTDVRVDNITHYQIIQPLPTAPKD